MEDADDRMRVVYRLENELAKDPEQVATVQALTLDPTRPAMGLRGAHGLFASAQWWQSIRDGSIPTERVRGVVGRVYRAGQDSSGPVNTVDIVRHDGSRESVGIRLDDRRDRHLFRVGCVVEVVYALDQLKRPAPDGGASTTRITLEVSVEPSGRPGERATGIEPA